MHLALKGEGPAPFSHFISRLCQEFPCWDPEAAYAAWLRYPSGFLEDIIEARAYASTKELVDQTKDASHLPTSEWVDLVQTIEFELVARAMKGEG